MSDLLSKIKDILGISKKEDSLSDINLSKNKELADSLKSMEEEYNNSLKIPEPNYEELFPKESGLYEKEYDEKSEDELLMEAEASLLPDYQKNIDKLNAQTETKEQKLLEKEEKTKLKEENEIVKLADKTEGLLEKNQQSMINRGLTHSSIFSEAKNDIDLSAKSQLAKINADYDMAYNSIKNEINSLTISYENSLQQYEIKYAADLEKKLTSLKAAEQKRLDEITKYNLNVAASEEKYQKEREENIAKAKKEHQKTNEKIIIDDKNSGSEKRQAELENRYNTALNFYSQFDKKTAIKLINNNYDALMTAFGVDYFNKLLLAIDK